MILYAALFTWARLHNIQNATLLKTTVQEYQQHFPCDECKIHFTQLLNTHPFPLEQVHTPEDTQIWSWLTHNLVNQRLNKTWQPFNICNKSKTL